jgi:hypothetical protein
MLERLPDELILEILRFLRSLRKEGYQENRPSKGVGAHKTIV